MSAAPGPSPASGPARLPQRPIGSRLSTGHLATIISGLLAAALSYAVLRGGSNIEVAVAATNLQSRQTITEESFRFESMRLPSSAAKGFVTRKDAAAYRGGSVLVSVPKGGLIASSMLAPRTKATVREVPVPVEAIPQGLAVGDLVDIGWPNSKDKVPLIFGAKVTWIDPKPLSPSISVALDYHDATRYLTASGTGKLRIAILREADAPATAPTGVGSPGGP
jgi:hypothetical protein